MKVVLASGSPRRKELLEQIGVKFTIQPAQGEEVIHSTVPEEVVKELSHQKAEEVYRSINQREDCVVLGADTVVSFEEKILGKPVDEAHAFQMLKSLQGHIHHVYTGVTVCGYHRKEKIAFTFAEKTEVTMYGMTDAQIRQYIATGEPMDKAGSYGIQGKGAVYIKKINGDYNNVVGLPIAKLFHMLQKQGISMY